jgi:two-component system sensor histidine kinase UhpB
VLLLKFSQRVISKNLSSMKTSSTFWKDLIRVLLLGLVFFFIASFFELSERVAAFVKPLEHLQLDELPLVLLLVFFSLVGLMWRRAKQLKEQTIRQLETQTSLEVASEENRRLALRYLEVQELERKNLARELHDEFGQSLNAIMIDGVFVRDNVEKGSEIHKQASSIVEVASRVYESVRSLLRQLRPIALDELGIVSALEHLTNEWKARSPNRTWEFSAREIPEDLSEAVSIGLYRIVQESYTNVIKHSDATYISTTLSLEQRDQTQYLRLDIHDNGKLLGSSSPEGMGLIGLKERVDALGGSLESGPCESGGFRLVADIPLRLQVSGVV